MTEVVPRTANVAVVELEDGETVEIEYEWKIDGDDQSPAAYAITPAQARRWYDDAVRTYMGMSSEEFLRRWDAGEWHELYDDMEYWYIAHLVETRPRGEPES